MNESNTCRKYVEPKLNAAGWDDEPHSYTEQHGITDGRIQVIGNSVRRQRPKKADYLLRYTRDVAIAIVEAKADYKHAADGLQQAKNYAEMMGLKFAYSTNGHGIVEFDYLTGATKELDAFPTPGELWKRLQKGEGFAEDQAQRWLTPANLQSGRKPRYYQEIAINRVVGAILKGQKRVLLTMATGTGKTPTAFQICWKLTRGEWNARGTGRKPRILYLADRDVLLTDPEKDDFAPFGEARKRLRRGEVDLGREMIFATYQALMGDENGPPLYTKYPKDHFDLIVVDECHRGSARDDSSWRDILKYFEPAYQLGLTATPKREENADSYDYFGDPVYTYSLRQGIEDGFLAPYRVHRIVTSVDAVGYRPSKGELDQKGNAIPDGEYTTKDFHRVIDLRNRTKAIAKSITDHLKGSNRYDKTIVFCVDQEHASDMALAIASLNQDLMQKHPFYVARVTADEAEIGKTRLSEFQDVEGTVPVILTTSQLLTTGVNAPTVKNVVLARVINSMTEFKQIIGRGTRVREEYGKLFFNILDYTGSATTNFADPTFDGEPLPPEGSEYTKPETPPIEIGETPREYITHGPLEPDAPKVRKFYVRGGSVEIAAHVVYELDADGKRLSVVQYTEYAGQSVKTLFRDVDTLRKAWADPVQRQDVVEALADRGVEFEELAAATGQPDADAFDLLCHVAFGAPVRTRKERADEFRKRHRDFLDQYSGIARDVLEALLVKYSEYGAESFVLPDVLRVPPLSGMGSLPALALEFGGAAELSSAVTSLYSRLYL